MARRTYKRLTVAAIKAIEATGKPGLYPDGDGLAVQKTPAGVCSWIYRYQVGGSEHRMGLGALRHVSLSKARGAASDARQMRRAGTDPLEERHGKRRATATAKAKAMTFEACARAYVAAHSAGWKNAKHREQWPSSLERFVFGYFGDVPVQEVDVGLVMKAIEPIWTQKPETAGRVRGRIESVLDWAAARGYRQGDNPARWRGHLDKLLPKKSKVRRVEHHAALPYAEIGSFLVDLQRSDSVSAKLLQFIILTACRSGEARGARWDEIDMAERLWTIPAERMKAGREHRVPLSNLAMAVLQAMGQVRSSPFVFSGLRGPLSASALPKFLHDMGRADITTHGFRSTFRDWCGEATNFPREVAEAALAHAISNQTERAYARGDALRKRAQLMQAWAKFGAAASPGTADILPLRRK